MLKRCFVICTLLFVLVFLFATPVFAQEDAPEATVTPSFLEVLTLLAGGGGLGTIVSFLAEQSKGFQNLQANQKKFVVLGLMIGLPLIATALVQFVPANVWILLEPYWKAIAAGFAGWAGSQFTYLWQKRVNGQIKA